MGGGEELGWSGVDKLEEVWSEVSVTNEGERWRCECVTRREGVINHDILTDGSLQMLLQVGMKSPDHVNSHPDQRPMLRGISLLWKNFQKCGEEKLRQYRYNFLLHSPTHPSFLLSLPVLPSALPSYPVLLPLSFALLIFQPLIYLLPLSSPLFLT